VDQAQLELQLKVWKELAISKQVLMRTAAESLKLDPECSQDELKKALDAAIRKSLDADASVSRAEDKARSAVNESEKKLTVALKAQALAETTIAELTAKQENLTSSMAVERASVAKELQKLKDQLAEKERALKGINTALADTPENVIKKMKTLQKQRQEEADARRAVEASFGTLRKEKQTQDQLTQTQTASTTKLVTRYRELHAAATTVHEQLKPLLAEGTTAPALPDLDTTLLEEIENPGDKKDKDKKDKSKDRSRK
jgi:colicin import membrane protein